MDLQAITDGIVERHWVDHVGLAVLGSFLLLGIWRGLWWQVVRMLGLAAAVGVARWAGPAWGGFLEGWLELQPPVALGLGWLSAFLLTLLGVAFLGMLGSRTIEAMKLSLINRSLGGVAGLLTGLLLHSALVMVGAAFAPSAWRSEVLPGTWSGQAVEALTERWPILSAARGRAGHFGAADSFR